MRNLHHILISYCALTLLVSSHAPILLGGQPLTLPVSIPLLYVPVILTLLVLSRDVHYLQKYLVSLSTLSRPKSSNLPLKSPQNLHIIFTKNIKFIHTLILLSTKYSAKTKVQDLNLIFLSAKCT